MHSLRMFLTASITLAAGCGAANSNARPQPATVAPVIASADPAQKFAELGSCVLESGERIEACRIGYRTFGRLDAAKSNVVLFPTWFTGTTKQLVDIVPGGLVDTDRFFVVLVDAPANGVTSSPSNSRAQPRLRFPKVSIADMVDMERRLLREVLKVDHVRAVMGISMGGMQAQEWAVRYPTEMDRVVSIAGTPQLTAHDMLLWNTELRALESDTAYRGGEYEGHPPMRAVRLLHAFALHTPEFRAKDTSRADFETWRTKVEDDTSFDWNDWHRQLEAMLGHDVARKDGGSLAAVARRIKAKTMFVVASRDGMVHPGPSMDLARALNAEQLVLDGPCGHVAPSCEGDRVRDAVRKFMLP